MIAKYINAISKSVNVFGVYDSCPQLIVKEYKENHADGAQLSNEEYNGIVYLYSHHGGISGPIFSEKSDYIAYKSDRTKKVITCGALCVDKTTNKIVLDIRDNTVCSDQGIMHYHSGFMDDKDQGEILSTAEREIKEETGSKCILSNKWIGIITERYCDIVSIGARIYGKDGYIHKEGRSILVDPINALSNRLTPQCKIAICFLIHNDPAFRNRKHELESWFAKFKEID